MPSPIDRHRTCRSLTGAPHDPDRSEPNLVGGSAPEARLPGLDDALNVDFMSRRFAELDAGIVRGAVRGALAHIELRRLKPGRRCLIRYTFEPSTESPLVLLGKMRARGPDFRTPRLMRMLVESRGLEAVVAGVPEPLGAFPDLNLWLQRQVEGSPLGESLLAPGATTCAARAAEAVDALHRSGVRTDRRHSMSDELVILRDRFARTAILHPGLATRLSRLFEACEREAADHHLIPSDASLVHRDFHPDQVLVDGPRLWLLDLDLHAMGDPCLDHGNFLAHLTELALRVRQDPDGLREAEKAYRERAVELRGPAARRRIAVYQSLSLARHVYLSTQYADRHETTLPLLELCERRLRLPTSRSVAFAI